MSFDLFPNEQNATLLNAARHPSTTPDAGTWGNFLPGAASYGMRSLAEVGRAVDLAGSVFPIAYDWATGDKNNTQRDKYFAEHDAVFNSAVDYWTPRPGEVGTAGQIAGQLAGGILQASISPALLVGTAQLSTAEDLTREGVDPGAANVVGDIAGIGAAVGLKLPFLGKTLASRVLTGATGNVVQGAATAGASHTVLDAAGSPEQAAQYNATDLKGRLIDALMGAAFGGLAHLEAGSGRKLTPQEDYKQFLAETGLSKEAVETRSNSTADMVPMPPGVSKITRQKSAIEGDGMFATESVAPGDILAPARIDGKRTPAGRYTNHSNEPNAEFRPTSSGDLNLVALKPINEGTEVLIDYRQAGEVNGTGIRKLTPTEEAALLVANQARHLEDTTLPGRPATEADLTQHVQTMREAVDQMLRGEPVNIDATAKGMQMHPDPERFRQRAEMMDEVLRVAKEQAPPTEPIQAPLRGVDSVENIARRAVEETPDMMLPTGETNPDGSPTMVRAADAIAHTDMEAAHAKTNAPSLFQTAANCLLGAL